MRIVALLTVPCAVALLFALVASKLTSGPATPQPVSAPTQAIVWNSRVFFDREELKKWLHSRGVSYDAWVAKHPQSRGKTLPVARAKTKGSGWHLPSRHTLLVGVGAGGIVVLGALALVFLGRLARFLRSRELPHVALPTRRREPDLTPMGALLYERTPEKPESFRVRRRLDLGFALAASSAGVGLALVLPHLYG